MKYQNNNTYCNIKFIFTIYIICEKKSNIIIKLMGGYENTENFKKL